MIVKIKSKCETCAHEKVCVKKDGMQTIEHEFDNILGSESYAGAQRYMDQKSYTIWCSLGTVTGQIGGEK